jgi:hypothetical protein
VRYALEARELDPNNPHTQGVASRVLAAIYEKREELLKAVRAYEVLLAVDKKQGKFDFARKTQHKIDCLRRRMK